MPAWWVTSSSPTVSTTQSPGLELCSPLSHLLRRRLSIVKSALSESSQTVRVGLEYHEGF